MRCSDEMRCWRRVLYLAGLLRRRFGAVCGWVGRRHSHMLLSHNRLRVLCHMSVLPPLRTHFGPAARGMKLAVTRTINTSNYANTKM
jgi:hypothetical protein